MARLAAVDRPRALRHLALEAGSQVLHQRRFGRRLLASLKGGGDRQRKPPECPEVGRQAPDRRRSRGRRQRGQEREGAEEALGPAPLVGQLRGDLLPALAEGADDHPVGDEAVAQDHLVEVVLAGEQPDRPDLDARALQIDDDLAQAEVAVIAEGLAADQRDHRVGEVGARGPDLRPVQAPASVDLFCRGPDRGQVGAGVGLAHADRELDLAARHAGQEAQPLLLGPVAQEQGPGLAVGDPVRRHRGTRGQQLLDHDVALEGGALRGRRTASARSCRASRARRAGG